MATVTPIFELPPKETTAQLRARELLASSNELQEVLLHKFDNLYRGLWNSDVPAIEIIEAMGTNAAMFFIKATALVAFLAEHCAVTFSPEEVAAKLPLGFNEDGTVYLLEE